MKEKLAFILVVTALLGTFFGAYWWIETRYALSEDLRMVAQRLDYKIASDQLQSIQQRIWQIKDRCGEFPKDMTTKEELRKLEEDKKQLQDKLKTMEKK